MKNVFLLGDIYNEISEELISFYNEIIKTATIKFCKTQKLGEVTILYSFGNYVDRKWIV